MSKKPVYLMVLVIVLMGVLGVSINIHKVEAPYPIIRIKADGSIDPPTANITSPDNVTYTFTDNINASIVVERSNATIDGVGFTLQGAWGAYGFNLTNVSNVTIKNMRIKAFNYGIYLWHSANNTILGNKITNNSMGIMPGFSNFNTISGNTVANNDGDGIRLYASSNFNTITGNNITNNHHGISLGSSSNNSVSGNNIANNVDGIMLGTSSNYNSIFENNIANNWYGIRLDWYSSNNIVSGNNITANNETGVYLKSSSNNTVSGNNIANNDHGIWLEESESNEFYHNSLIDNINQTYVEPGYANSWDNGYPSGGNYWSDYTDVDEKSGLDQDQPNSDGIWDHPYVIDGDNQDNYPIVPEFPSFLILPLFMIPTLLVVVICRRKYERQE